LNFGSFFAWDDEEGADSRDFVFGCCNEQPGDHPGSPYYGTFRSSKEEDVQKITFYQGVGGFGRAPKTFVNSCAQAFVFCIALPMACCVIVFRGIRLLFRLLFGLSFTCCVWIFLAALTLLFLLVFVVQFAAASVGC